MDVESIPDQMINQICEYGVRGGVTCLRMTQVPDLRGELMAVLCTDWENPGKAACLGRKYLS